MIGTINCTYETPCGWCTKWDKKCDRKIGCRPQGNYDGLFKDKSLDIVLKQIKENKNE
jgi:hypothetical protein